MPHILKLTLKQVFKTTILRILTTLIGTLFLLPNILLAQGTNPDFFRSIGKMYAVVAVVLTILVGIFLFLFYLERKIKKLENQFED